MEKLSKLAKKYIAKNRNEIEARAGNANKVSFWWMYDCHLFEEIKAKSLDDAIRKANKLRLREDGMGAYGMLAAPKLSYNGKEVRSVGISIHARGRKDSAHWAEQAALWIREAQKDKQLVAILATTRAGR